METKIKMIAVDMDGTFLDKDKTYNKPYFWKLFHRMKEKGIHFVAASGNQFPQLQMYFSEIEQEMSFVAENGAYILEKGQEVYSADMGLALAEQAIIALEYYSDTPFVVCGKKTAYVHREIPEASYELFKRYYRCLEKVEDFQEIDDVIFKFATAFEENEVPEVLRYLEGELQGKLVPVASGYGFIDLIQPNVHKGNAIQLLQKNWQVAKEESAAFGDSPNDLEMLQSVGWSFAMENADDEVKGAAKKVIGENNSESLLRTIEELIAE